MTITEYEHEFMRLSKYTQECVSTEAIMCKRFEDRLNEDIRIFVGILEPKEFVILVEKACKAKELAKEKRKVESEARDSKKRSLGKSFQSTSKKSRDFHPHSNASVESSNRNRGKQYLGTKAQTTSISSVGHARLSRLECPQCGRHHSSEFRGSDRTCFKYSFPDHFIKECPEMVEKERYSARSGNTNNQCRPQKNLGSGASSKNTPKESVVRLEGSALGMMYAILAREEASFLGVISENCGRKFIELKCENSDILQVESDESNSSPVVISSMTTQKCVRKGYEAYLAFVLNTQESEVKIKPVPMVYEYVDVFSEELTGLPPTREVEFGTKLVLGMAPISVTLYKMALLELKELKVHYKS
ncbi:uncharacterized protein [Gossypium hirsutum]|uniref:Gag-Pol polyprotein n=1 Tax=Gossypium hirsutum TaxID=3635 RepID=A0A1U8MJZ0_GOSHI|nr:uncharacterized protein LOC107937531 [Gossypium hirsutum]